MTDAFLGPPASSPGFLAGRIFSQLGYIQNLSFMKLEVGNSLV